MSSRPLCCQTAIIRLPRPQCVNQSKKSPFIDIHSMGSVLEGVLSVAAATSNFQFPAVAAGTTSLLQVDDLLGTDDQTGMVARLWGTLSLRCRGSSSTDRTTWRYSGMERKIPCGSPSPEATTTSDIFRRAK